MTKFFITASGTEIGKTFVTSALIHQLRQRNLNVHALKPVATGLNPDALADSDSGILLEALGLPANTAGVASITPWRFNEPLSPDMAAARENRSIPFNELVAFCDADHGADVTLIEGIGGVMVPLDGRHTVLDWIAALEAPTILVTGSYLGALSHTLTAVGMLHARDVEVAGIVVNASEAQPVALEETTAVISRFSGAVPIQSLERLHAPDQAPNLLPLLAPYL